MAQLLYIALGFGVGLSVAGAAGALVLLRWTKQPKTETREATERPDTENVERVDAAVRDYEAEVRTLFVENTYSPRPQEILRMLSTVEGFDPETVDIEVPRARTWSVTGGFAQVDPGSEFKAVQDAFRAAVRDLEPNAH